MTYIVKYKTQFKFKIKPFFKTLKMYILRWTKNKTVIGGKKNVSHLYPSETEGPRCGYFYFFKQDFIHTIAVNLLRIFAFVSNKYQSHYYFADSSAYAIRPLQYSIQLSQVGIMYTHVSPDLNVTIHVLLYYNSDINEKTSTGAFEMSKCNNTLLPTHLSRRLFSKN